MKVTFLYKITRYIEWPGDAFFNDPEAPIRLGILGKDPFKGTLHSIKDKRIQHRSIEIHRYETIEDLERCHILFVSESERERLSQIFIDDRIRAWHTLTIGDMDGFIQQGGIINLVVVNKKIRFEINLKAAGQAGLKISSKLLKLAKIVIR